MGLDFSICAAERGSALSMVRALAKDGAGAGTFHSGRFRNGVRCRDGLKRRDGLRRGDTVIF